MKKNYVIATVLIFLILVAGNWLQIKLVKKNAPVKTTGNATLENTESKVSTQTDTAENIVTVENVLEAESEESITEKTYTVETDIVKAVFTNKGGDLISYKLKHHNNSGSNENVEMIRNISETNRAFSISLGGYANTPLDNIFSVTEKTNDDGKKGISFVGNFTIKNASGLTENLKISKHYLFVPSEYMFELIVTIEGGDNFSALNYGNASYTIRSTPQIGPDWDKNDRYDFRRFSSFIEGKKKDKVLKTGETVTDIQGSAWTAISGKYFTFVMVPNNINHKVTYSANNENTKFKTENTQFFITQQPMLTSSVQHTYKIYLGPTSENYLNRYSSANKNAFGFGNLGLDTLASGSGFLAPLIFVLKWLLQFVNSFVHNWGVAIIVVTIFIRLALLPLSIKTMVGTQKIQPYQAQISQIQQKYSKNPQKMQEELGKIYEKAGYRPGCATGCLPLVLQFAVIIAMFQLFNNYFEFRGATFIPGWISDLSLGDSVYTLKQALPILGWTEIRLLPIIYVATQYISTLLTKNQNQPRETQSMMFVMMYIMPAMFFFMLYNAPSGLFVYWITSNLLMIVQQFITNAIVKHEFLKN